MRYYECTRGITFQMAITKLVTRLTEESYRYGEASIIHDLQTLRRHYNRTLAIRHGIGVLVKKLAKKK